MARDGGRDRPGRGCRRAPLGDMPGAAAGHQPDDGPWRIDVYVWFATAGESTMNKGHDVPTYTPIIHLRSGAALRLPGGLTHDQAQAAGRREAEGMSGVEYVAVKRDGDL